MKWLFVGPEGLRSGWRLTVFGLVWLGLTTFLGGIALALTLGLKAAFGEIPGERVVMALVVVLVTVPAPITQVLVSRFIDGPGWNGSGLVGPPLRSSGELLAGLVLGTLCNVLCVPLLWLTSFGVADASVSIAFVAEPIWLLSAPVLAFVLLMAATWEEVLLRGYPLAWSGRFMANAGIALFGESWRHTLFDLARPLALVGSSLLFALLHLGNPNNAGPWPVLNTLLAGMWLGVAVYRTRALWLAIGMHVSWNATMALLLGIPVSGMGAEDGSMPTLLRTTLTGPDWFSGGSYGLEASAACTVMLIGCTTALMLFPARPDEQAMPALSNEPLTPSS